MNSMHSNLLELSPARCSFRSHSVPPEQSIIIPGSTTRRCDTPHSKSSTLVEPDENHRALIEDDSIRRLKDEYLQNERIRSDPLGSWLEEQQWMRAAIERPLSPKSIWRFYQAMGVEVLDKDGMEEYMSDQPDLLQCG